jgi:hypothetical protein
MKTKVIVIFMILFLSSKSYSTIFWQDGLTHTINYAINDDVVVDYDSPGVGTIVELVNGGSIKDLRAHYDSRINIYGGSGNGITVSDNVNIFMNGGTISGIGGTTWTGNIIMYGGTMTGQFSISNHSQASIYNGSINNLVAGSDRGTYIYDGEFNRISSRAFNITSIFGGIISEDITTIEEGLIKLNGNNFYVNGNLMQYGQSARLYGIPGVNQYGTSYLGGNITGILSNGDVLNVPFYIYENSDITFVPEPATILLLSVGIVFLRKKR